MSMIQVHKLDEYGQHVLSYEGQLLERGTSWVCLRAVFQPRHVDVAGIMTLSHGDVFIEWFYSDRWYNVFQVFDGMTGHLKGWYCNITRPAQLDSTAVRADDLALDVIVEPNGEVHVLDEDEFDALNLSEAERAAALHAVQTIRRLVVERSGPFQSVSA